MHLHYPRRGKVNAMKELVERVRTEHNTRVNLPLLYRCEQLYRLLDGDFARFESWINASETSLGRPIYWKDVVERLLGGRANPRIIGREEADRLDLAEVESAVEALERAFMRAYEGDEQASGTLEGIRQTLQGLSLLKRNDSSPVRDNNYLVFVRRHGCAVCNQPADAHHALGTRGHSTKPSDYACIPLCRRHHAAVHQYGATYLERMYNIDVFETAFNLFHCYATGKWLTLRLEKIK